MTIGDDARRDPARQPHERPRHGDEQTIDQIVFASLPQRPFPGGRLLARPLATLGLLWYALRDRL